MAVTRWIIPDYIAEHAKDGGSTWNNPSNAEVSNDTRAISVMRQDHTNWLLCMHFWFTSLDIPVGSLINGVEIKVERQSSDESKVMDGAVYLRYIGEQIGDNGVKTPLGWKTDEDEIITFGGPADLWGTSLTQEMICQYPGELHYVISPDCLAPNTEEARVDCTWIRIFYTPPADPDTGWKLPQTVENIAREYTDAWANPEYAKLSNDNRAISTDIDFAQFSDWLRCTNFGFADDIPSGSRIDGIKVRIERQSNNATALIDDAIYLRKTSGQVGDNKASAAQWFLDSDEAPFYGGVDDLWNAELTLEDILSSDFGIDIAAICNLGKNAEARIDSVQIGIYYTPVQESIELHTPINQEIELDTPINQTINLKTPLDLEHT